MPERVLVPSIEQRLAGLMEVTRRKDQEAEKKGKRKLQTITISREFGCEAYPMTEKLKAILEEKTREPWSLIDKSLMAEVEKNHSLSENILDSLGKRPRFLDELFSLLSPRWKNEKDHYQLLCDHIVSLADAGNVIIVGMGSAVITQQLDNCYHFRLYASPEFKTRSIARRLKISRQEAELVVEKRQKERDVFIRNFLNATMHDLSLYHLVINNDRNPAERMARTIAEYVMTARL